MSLTPHEQFAEILAKVEHPLILLPSHPGKEAVAAGYAFHRYLRNLGKIPSIAGEHLSAQAKHLSFLDVPADSRDNLTGTRDFVLVFRTAENPILRTRAEEGGGEFRIFITPERGSIDPRDFSFIPAQLPFDAVFTLGLTDRESIGSLFLENPDIFYEVPVVNIDNRAENERFGQVNLVDLTAASIGEILADLFEAFRDDAFDGAVAEALLASIMSGTESFLKKSTTPRSLTCAAKLIDRGADREKVVMNLYKVQPLSSIRLWGRMMSDLKWDESRRLALSFVSVADFVETRASHEDLPGILDKIRGHFSAGSIFAAIYQESASAFRAVLKAADKEPLENIRRSFPEALVSGDMIIFAVTAADAAEAESKLLAAIPPVSA